MEERGAAQGVRGRAPHCGSPNASPMCPDRISERFRQVAIEPGPKYGLKSVSYKTITRRPRCMRERRWIPFPSSTTRYHGLGMALQSLPKTHTSSREDLLGAAASLRAEVG